jgi:hypothetical protein
MHRFIEDFQEGDSMRNLDSPTVEVPAQRPGLSRRSLLAGGAAGAGLALSGGLLAMPQGRASRPSDSLVTADRLGPRSLRDATNALFTPTAIVGPANVCADLGFQMLPGTLDANLFISAAGDAEGEARVSWPFGREATITIEGNNVVITSDDGAVIDLQSTDLSNPNWRVDGEEINPPDLIGPVLEEIRDNPDPAGWSSHALNLAALVSLASTPVWQQNTEIAMLASASPGFWCKVSCGVVAGIIAAAAVAGCAAAVAACAGATAVTLGGIAVPCALILKLCTGAVLAGGVTFITIVAYEAWLEFVWG